MTGAHDAAAHSCAKTGEVRFRAADGTRLAGHRFGSGTTGIVFAHEVRGGACRWIPYARQLATKGYTTLAIDFRGYGDSQRRTGAGATRLAADLTAAVKLLRTRGATRVVLVGASMGGTIALVAASHARPPVDAVVALSPPSTWAANDALAAVRKLQMPVLYVVGKFDVDFEIESRNLYLATASPVKRLVVVESSTHGVGFFSDASARALIEEFIKSPSAG